MITTRLYAVNMPDLSPLYLELENFSFRQEEFEDYLTKIVGDRTISNSIKEFASQDRLVWGFFQIMAQLDALCYPWDDGFRSDVIPRIMTLTFNKPFISQAIVFMKKLQAYMYRASTCYV